MDVWESPVGRDGVRRILEPVPSASHDDHDGNYYGDNYHRQSYQYHVDHLAV